MNIVNIFVHIIVVLYLLKVNFSFLLYKVIYKLLKLGDLRTICNHTLSLLILSSNAIPISLKNIKIIRCVRNICDINYT